MKVRFFVVDNMKNIYSVEPSEFFGLRLYLTWLIGMQNSNVNHQTILPIQCPVYRVTMCICRLGLYHLDWFRPN